MNKHKLFTHLIVISALFTVIFPAQLIQTDYSKSQIKQKWTYSLPFNLPARPIIQTNETAAAAPDMPVLVSPADGAVGISTSPTLTVNVSDPDADALTVTFYGRTRDPGFTLVALPNTQKYTTNGSGIFGIQTQWIVDQQAAENIAFVSHLGNLVDDWDVPNQWNIANAAMSTLETPEIPYGIGFGNCDEDYYGAPPVRTTFLNTYFPASRFSGRSYYASAYNGDNSNSYQLFSANGMDFVVVNLMYNLSSSPEVAESILNWADAVLKTNSNRRAIVVTHSLLDLTNNFTADGTQIYNKLKSNPNLFLMLGAHISGEGQRQDLGDDGHTIYSLRSAYFSRANGGDGWLRLLRFSPNTNQINVFTYSPYLDLYETDADSQFSLDYTMNAGTYQVIGSTTVPSNSDASVVWPDLVNNRQYEWYVTVEDGSATTTGPTWSFITESGSIAPVISIQPNNQTYNAGQVAIFSASASGSPNPTVQWQSSADNGTTWDDITGATSSVLSFTAQAADNGKRYQAVFTNGAGSTTTNAAILTVYNVPVIITQPVNLTVTAGQLATFTAAATGNPSPTIQWQVSTDNGTTWGDIAGATSTTYSFTTQTADNSKQYCAVFTNAAGSSNTNAALLNVQFAPVVTTQPLSQTVTAGQTANFSVATDGNPTPTVQWQVSTNNGSTWSNISGATSTSYSFAVQVADNGKQFQAVLTNSVGSAYSNAAILTVNYAPSVTTQPTNQTVNAGQVASFNAAASGNPYPKVQWQVSTDSGVNWSNIVGETSTTYSFTTQATDNGKQYRAVFTNSVGSATSIQAILTVNSSPVITIQPVNQTVNAGQTATFTAAASGNPSPTVQWQVFTNGTMWTDISGATSPTYTFTTQAADNGKQYRAVFTNAAGSSTTNVAVLTVYFAPAITTQPANQTANAGQNVSFSAAASGNPNPTVQWQVSTNGTTWTDIPGATSATYSFTAQAYDNGEQYRAVFTNFLGPATSNPATLTVYIAPAITTQPTNQTVNAGQNASFSAAASGNPSPTVQWQVSTNNGSTWSNISGATSTTYNLSAQAADNGKQYRAVFTNTVGSTASDAAVLTVYFAPSVTTQPTNQTVNDGQTASFTAAVNGNPTPTVQWQVSTDNGNNWSNISGANSATYSFTTQAIDNGNQYRAVFTNIINSATTEVATLTIYFAPSVTTHPTNQTVDAGQTASFTATANGNPTPSVQWQVSTNNGNTWSNISGATSTTYSFTAQATDSGKQYHAVFTNSGGTVNSDPATLTVYTVPAVTLNPIDQTVLSGEMVTFTAAASGNPTPTVQWQVSTNGTTWSDISGATSATYSFSAKKADDGKHFRAVFSNLVGSDTSGAAVLTVNNHLSYIPLIVKSSSP